MDSNKPVSPDEQPKRKVAKRVITQKRQYFVPAYNKSVEAETAEDAVTEAQRLSKEEDGDAK